MVEQCDKELQETRTPRQIAAQKRQDQLLKDALISKQKKLSLLRQKHSYTSLNVVQRKSSVLTVCDTFTSMSANLDETFFSTVYGSPLLPIKHIFFFYQKKIIKKL